MEELFKKIRLQLQRLWGEREHWNIYLQYTFKGFPCWSASAQNETTKKEIRVPFAFGCDSPECSFRQLSVMIREMQEQEDLKLNAQTQ